MAKSKEAELWRTLIPLVESFVPLRREDEPFWEFFVPIHRKWRRFTITQYRGTFHFFGEDFGPVLVDPQKTASAPLDKEVRLTLTALAIELESIRDRVAEDDMEYHRWLNRTLAPRLRYGVIARRFTRELLPDFLRYDRELTENEKKAMIPLLERHPEVEGTAMTADRYFEYCTVAYRANPGTFGKAFDASMSGREMYEHFADGRDGGLLELSGDSERAFDEWLEGNEWRGAHPWEIYRGGDATHIELQVVRDELLGGIKVVLDAFSSTRLVECCRIALALEKSGFPFEMTHRESYHNRLLEQDWVGVVPEGRSLSYGWQELPSELGVADCVHFAWFLDQPREPPLSRSRIASLISWLPIRPLFLW